jgi:hypothetical protein
VDRVSGGERRILRQTPGLACCLYDQHLSLLSQLVFPLRRNLKPVQVVPSSEKLLDSLLFRRLTREDMMVGRIDPISNDYVPGGEYCDVPGTSNYDSYPG